MAISSERVDREPEFTARRRLTVHVLLNILQLVDLSITHRGYPSKRRQLPMRLKSDSLARNHFTRISGGCSLSAPHEVSRTVSVPSAMAAAT